APAARLHYGIIKCSENRAAALPRVTRTFRERAPQTRYSTDLPPELSQEPAARKVLPSPEKSVTSAPPSTRMRRSPSSGVTADELHVLPRPENLPRIVVVVEPDHG